MKKTILSIILFALFLNANCQYFDFNLFPVYGITLSKTTLKEIKSLGYKCENKSCDVQDLWFWDHDGDNIVESIYIVRPNQMPQIWIDNYAFNWSLSYTEWLMLLGKFNFTIKIEKEPTIDIFQGKNTLSAEVQAKSPTGKTIISLHFNSGNENNEGYSISSKNSLHSIKIDAFDIETELDLSQGIVRKYFRSTEEYLRAKYWKYSLSADANYYSVSLNDKKGVCDLQGTEIIACKYDDIFKSQNDYGVSLNGKKGSCNMQGKEIVPCKYDNVFKCQDGYYYISLNKKKGYCDLSGKEIIPCKYDIIYKYQDNYGVTLNGKKGSCDLTGKEIIPCKYDKILKFDTHYSVTLNGKNGICDLAGTEIIPCKYYQALRLENSYYVSLNGKEGSFDLYGNIIVAIPDISVVENHEIELSGDWGYQIDYNTQTVRITGSKINNKATDGKSGTIKISLYLTDTEYTGGSINGYALVHCQLEPLSGGYTYTDINKLLKFDVNPPSNNYYITILLLEYTNSGYVIRDYLNFDGTVAFVNRNTEQILNTFNNSLNILNSNNQYTLPPNNTSPNSTSGHWDNVTCPYCKGTGVQESPSYGASYGLDRSSKDRCDVCGKFENHYHANCIPCQGKGSTQKYVP